MSTASHAFRESDDPIDVAAARWLARQDRGLSASEQDEYLQWLRETPRHGEAITRLGKTWKALDALADWRPKHSVQPNPDLLARPARRLARSWSLMALGFMAAAAIVLGLLWVRSDRRAGSATNSGESVVVRGLRVIPKPDSLVLEDGSVVVLNQGGKIEKAFTTGERRLRLLRGEAHFTVTKNPARPFVVEVGTVAVRAVGTAFDVRRGAAEVEVLVTEGKVNVERSPTTGAETEPTPLVAGERTVVDTTAGPSVPQVSRAGPADIERAYTWQGVRLEFTELPLSEVIAEFNLRNRRQLAVADPETGRLRISGNNFRADNVEGFVRLLESSFGVEAERRDGGSIVLHLAK